MSITSINAYEPGNGLTPVRSKAPVSDVAVELKKPPVEEVQPNAKEMANAVENLNKVIATSLQSIQFSMDDESGKVVVKVLDTETKQVLRQIPNPEVLAISKNLARLQGLFISDRA